MKDAKGHGSEARGGGSGADNHPMDMKKTLQANAGMHSFKKGKHQRGSGGGGGGGGSSGGGQGGGSMQKHKTGAHTAGIHKALKMNLAQLSAAGTNPAIPKPVIGGRS
jgi:hypothetical protein